MHDYTSELIFFK